MNNIPRGTIVGREDATPELLFDMFANSVARMERTEQVLMLVSGVLLEHLGKISPPGDGSTLEEAIAEIADYMLLVMEARDRAMADVSFLNSRE